MVTSIFRKLFLLNSKSVYLKEINLKNYFYLFFQVAVFFSYSQNPIIFSTTGSTTWTVPTCVTQVTVEVWGGGGGGGAVWSKFDPTDNGSQSAEACTAAGGGGGGGYSRRVYTVTPGQVYNINVGNGLIIDTVNNRIRKVQFKPNDWYFSGGGPLRENVIGPVTTIAGSGQPGSSDGPALSATFNKLIAGCCNNLNGDYYVADNGNLIRKISNGIVSTILGPSNGLAKVISLVCVNNILYISDMGSQTRPAAIYRYGV